MGMEDTDVDAIVVGAGIAGLYMLYRLRSLGLRTRVLDAADGVGGTWLLNKYPGARCDIESMLYSYSFSPELQQEWTWMEKFASQPEILRYVNHVADRFDLRKDITLNTRVETAVFNETTNRWKVNQTLTCQFLIMATGVLSASKMPEIPGTEKFRGASYHTGHWPPHDVDFSNQRVAVIGTGSSAVQSIPLIAQQAQSLTVFQRTPCFAVPSFNRPLAPEEVADWKARYEAHRDGQRRSQGGGLALDAPATQPALAVPEEARRARYEALWRLGSLGALYGAFADTITDRASNETLCAFLRGKIRDEVDDPVTAEALSPRTYAYGTKRPCLHQGYYHTFNLPHVRLVDLQKTPILEITETGIRTAATSTGDYDAGTDWSFDAIVLATGYDAITGALTRIDVRGRGGVSLREKWAGGARSYLGIAVAGFPNLFTITGPLSPNVLSCMTVSIEQHVDWVAECIAFVRGRGRGLAAIEAEAAAEDAWVAHSDMVAGFTLLPGNAGSYYTGGNVEGKARGRLLAYIGGVGNYRIKCDDVAAKGYEGFILT